ncbi:MAG: alpha/beta fold hydrolase [Pseudomonadota bacterium]|nr:alpha/beta fold hydrolase [Pseudomonadota bacterium]
MTCPAVPRGLARQVRVCLAALAIATGLAACTPALQPAGPATVAPAVEAESFRMADGYRLPYRRTGPDNPVAVIVALHGYGDYRAAWDEPAERWAKAGIATYAYDQRGFGATARPGIWAGVPTLVADAREVVALVHARHPGVPLTLVGESMGSAVIMAMLGGGAPEGVVTAVLGAPAVRGRASLGPLATGMLDLVNAAMPGLRLSGGNVRIRASDNDAMLRRMGRDPLVQKSARVDALAGLVDLMDAAHSGAPGIDLPVLLMYGARDGLVPCAAVSQVVERFRVPPVVALYGNGYHMLFRDLDSPVVQHDALVWTLNPQGPLPSRADDRLAANGCRLPVAG